MEFPVPRIAPGPVQLRVSLLHREPHPAVDSCLGLHRCDTTMPSGLPKSAIPIEIQILD